MSESKSEISTLSHDEITYAEILSIKTGKVNYSPFLSALESLKQIRLPIKTSVEVKKMSVSVIAELKIAEEARNDIWKAKGIKVKDKEDQYTTEGLTKEQMEDFVEAINELGEIRFKSGLSQQVILPHSAEMTTEDFIQLERFLKLPDGG